MNFWDLSNDCYFCILKELDWKSLFSCLQISKKFYDLKNNEKLWQNLFLYHFPHNDKIESLSNCKNFLRLVLAKKLLDLNYESLKPLFGEFIQYSGHPKRNPNRAMFILMTGYNYNSIAKYNRKNLPLSLRQAFKSVGVECEELPLGRPYMHDEFLERLIREQQLIIPPRPGDMLIFLEYASTEKNCVVYTEEGICDCSNWFPFSTFHTIVEGWPSYNIDYWPHLTVVPKALLEQFIENLREAEAPISIRDIKKGQVVKYSFATLNNKKLYLFFHPSIVIQSEKTIVQLWYNNDYGENCNDPLFSFSKFGCIDQIEYLYFE